MHARGGRGLGALGASPSQVTLSPILCAWTDQQHFLWKHSFPLSFPSWERQLLSPQRKQSSARVLESDRNMEDDSCLELRKDSQAAGKIFSSVDSAAAAPWSHLFQKNTTRAGFWKLPRRQYAHLLFVVACKELEINNLKAVRGKGVPAFRGGCLLFIFIFYFYLFSCLLKGHSALVLWWSS